MRHVDVAMYDAKHRSDTVARLRAGVRPQLARAAEPPGRPAPRAGGRSGPVELRRGRRAAGRRRPGRARPADRGSGAGAAAQRPRPGGTRATAPETTVAGAATGAETGAGAHRSGNRRVDSRWGSWRRSRAAAAVNDDELLRHIVTAADPRRRNPDAALRAAGPPGLVAVDRAGPASGQAAGGGWPGRGRGGWPGRGRGRWPGRRRREWPGRRSRAAGPAPRRVARTAGVPAGSGHTGRFDQSRRAGGAGRTGRVGRSRRADRTGGTGRAGRGRCRATRGRRPAGWNLRRATQGRRGPGRAGRAGGGRRRDHHVLPTADRHRLRPGGRGRGAAALAAPHPRQGRPGGADPGRRAERGDAAAHPPGGRGRGAPSWRGGRCRCRGAGGAQRQRPRPAHRRDRRPDRRPAGPGTAYRRTGSRWRSPKGR